MLSCFFFCCLPFANVFALPSSPLLFLDLTSSSRRLRAPLKIHLTTVRALTHACTHARNFLHPSPRLLHASVVIMPVGQCYVWAREDMPEGGVCVCADRGPDRRRRCSKLREAGSRTAARLLRPFFLLSPPRRPSFYVTGRQRRTHPACRRGEWAHALGCASACPFAV